jgi:hypothetical protein
MKIKINWGTGILLAIIVFMLFIFTLVFFTTRQESDLVEKDYYPKALEYQQQIDKEQNSRNLSEKVIVKNTGEFIEVTFQTFFNPGDITGKAIFYRPSDEKGDITSAIHLDSAGCQRFPVSELQKGKYIIKLDYEVKGVAYYQEEPVYVKIF